MIFFGGVDDGRHGAHLGIGRLFQRAGAGAFDLGECDLVVTDIIMPRVTGVSLLKSIKKKSPHVQFILMTGEPSVETASEAVRSGAFDYLSKPIGKEQLLNTVANASHWPMSRNN